MERDPYWFYDDERYLNRFNPDYPHKGKFIPSLLVHPDDEALNAASREMNTTGDFEVNAVDLAREKERAAWKGEH